MQCKLPRVLVIGNNCFSDSDSNGRTLGNFFKGWDSDLLAQFYLQAAEPDSTYCKNFFRVTDKECLACFKNASSAGGIVKELEKIQNGQKATIPRRNALTMLARDFIWRYGQWRSKGFDEWVDAFNPEIVLLQGGDFPYMFDLAVDVATKHNIPSSIFNTEGYYFKNFDYFRGEGLAHMVYPVFHRRLKKSMNRAYGLSSCNFFSNEELKKDYKKHLGVDGHVLYTASDMAPVPVKDRDVSSFVVSYCGNLGNGRHEGLIQIAAVLQDISPSLRLDVYGRAPNADIEKKLEEATGMAFHGFVSYQEVQNVICNSDLLVHVESFDPFYVEDLRYGFSTKIADYISSGVCFLLYAPDSLSCSKYVKKNQVAYCVNSTMKLKEVLSELYSDPSARLAYRASALSTACRNHSFERNAVAFRNILSESLSAVNILI